MNGPTALPQLLKQVVDLLYSCINQALAVGCAGDGVTKPATQRQLPLAEGVSPETEGAESL